MPDHILSYYDGNRELRSNSVVVNKRDFNAEFKFTNISMSLTAATYIFCANFALSF